MKWIMVTDKPIPTDIPSLILVGDGSIHVGYPKEIRVWDGECWKYNFIWIVGGWEMCNYCGGENIISMEGSGTEKKAIGWMPSPLSYGET